MSIWTAQLDHLFYSILKVPMLYTEIIFYVQFESPTEHVCLCNVHEQCIGPLC